MGKLLSILSPSELYKDGNPKVAAKGPTELELSVLPGYRHPTKSLQALRKDILVISQLDTAIRNYRTKGDVVHLKRAVNLCIILSNVFEVETLEFAVYAVLQTDVWPEVATLLYGLKLSRDKKNLDKELLGLLSEISR
jgi:hypothetical protein